MAFPELIDRTFLKSTTKLSEEDYIKAWGEFHDSIYKPKGNKSLGRPVVKADKKAFTDLHGVLYDSKGLKIRPGAGSNKTFTRSMSNKQELTRLRRLNRENVLTYMFGGTPQTIQKASELAEKSGLGELTGHHRFGNAEFEPWIDDIIEGLAEPKGSKKYKKAVEILESGKSYFKGSKYFAGNVKQNYQMLTDLQHVAGENNIHKLLYENMVTGTPKGQSSFSFAKMSGGITVGDETVDTIDYIRNLPWTKEDSLKYIKAAGTHYGKGSLKGQAYKYLKGGIPDPNKLSRWSSLEDYLDISGGIRDELVTIAKKTNPNALENASVLGKKGALERLKNNATVGNYFQKQYGVTAAGGSKFASQVPEIPGSMMRMQSGGAAALQATDNLSFLDGIKGAPAGFKKKIQAMQMAGDIKGLTQLARSTRTMPWAAGLSIPLAEMAIREREKEVAANPNDPWRAFNLKLDRLSLQADYGSVGTYALAPTGVGGIVPAALEVTSNVTAGASGALDFGRWVKDPTARQETMDWWTNVYQRGARGLMKGAAAIF